MIGNRKGPSPVKVVRRRSGQSRKSPKSVASRRQWASHYETHFLLCLGVVVVEMEVHYLDLVACRNDWSVIGWDFPRFLRELEFRFPLAGHVARRNGKTLGRDGLYNRVQCSYYGEGDGRHHLSNRHPAAGEGGAALMRLIRDELATVGYISEAAFLRLMNSID